MLRISALVVLLCAVLAACGSGAKNTANAASPGATSSSLSPSTAPSAGLPVPGSTDLTKKPVIVVPSGPPPTSLVIHDIVTGTGATANSGASVTVQYVGVSYTTKQQFDASWDRNQPFPFQLGASQVIAGWDQGVAGMKVGGTRTLVIPSELGYGARGAGGAIPPHATLLFDVELLDVK
jgi:peptidylprolyl isomerase